MSGRCGKAHALGAELDPRLRWGDAVRGGWVYIMTNKPFGTLYIGVTSDVAARVWQHRHVADACALPADLGPSLRWGDMWLENARPNH
jgi:hypothetical protein